MEKFKKIVVLILLNCTYLVLANKRVIIIGAGPAGIAAASRLWENNISNILVLEAEPRIGGRVNSVKFGDAFIDLGAEWCHGEKDNVVFELVKDLNILGHTETPKKVCHSSRKCVDDKFGSELIELMETIYVPDGHRNEVEGKTVGEYCIEKYNTTIIEKYKNHTEKLEVALPAIDFFHHYVLSSEGAFSWFEPSAQNDYKDCEGDLSLNWNGLGYKTALEVLMKNHPLLKERILLNKEVTKIRWNKNLRKRAIRIECSDKTVFTGDHVIFTPSVGVLKERHQEMFDPPLPKNKTDAIRNIGFGAVMKVVMHFPNDWWREDNFTGFMFVWSQEDRKAIFNEFPYGPVRDGRSWLVDLFSLMPVEKNPNVLIGWLTGDMIPAIEVMPEETLIDGIMYVLEKFLDNYYKPSRPDQIIRSMWYSNSHFRGTYSFQTVAARSKDVVAEVHLAEPLENVYGTPFVHFAGEATHPYYFSTVHGAIETGYREADAIINLHK